MHVFLKWTWTILCNQKTVSFQQYRYNHRWFKRNYGKIPEKEKENVNEIAIEKANILKQFRGLLEKKTLCGRIQWKFGTINVNLDVDR